MSATIIPMRPKDPSKGNGIKEADMDCLVWAVLCDDEQTAFLRFHPHFSDNGGEALTPRGAEACRLFFSRSKHKDFMEAYRSTLSVATSAPSPSADSKERVLDKFASDVIASVEGNESLDPETLKTMADLLKRVGYLKEENGMEKIEPPRRYLPETCSSCEYKKFVEENIALGNIAVVDDDKD